MEDTSIKPNEFTVERAQYHERRAVTHWKTHEDKILREHYPISGGAGVRALLPLRTAGAIYCRAHFLNLPPPARRQKSTRYKYIFNDSIDAEIRRVYIERTTRNAINELAARLMFPRWVVSKRATSLGLKTPRFKEPDWTDAENELLESYSWQDPEQVARRFRHAGFKRTATAIAVRRKRLHLPTDAPGCYSANALAKLLGVDSKTVTRWIHAEGLPATRRGTERTPQQGGDEHVVKEADLRIWIRHHAQLVDLRKVERFWFIELAFGER